MEEGHLVREANRVERNHAKHRLLLTIKFIPHITAVFQIIYTLLEFADINAIILGHLIHLSVVSLIFWFACSIVFRYCYVHRLPLYYLTINELLSTTDYYIGIPVSVMSLFMIHLLFIGLLILGYLYYYYKIILTRKKVHLR